MAVKIFGIARRVLAITCARPAWARGAISHGDAVAGDGVFTTDRIGANSSASLGPHTIRIKAEVKDAAGVRHATAIEFGTLQVQP